MDDSTIQIYHVVLNEFEGRSSRDTGLAFWRKLNALVSSAANAEIIVSDYSDKFEGKKKSCIMQIPVERAVLSSLLNTHVQFHQDEQCFLAVNEFELAIYETTELECETQ